MQSKNIHTQLNIQFPSLEDALNLRKGDLSGAQGLFQRTKQGMKLIFK